MSSHELRTRFECANPILSVAEMSRSVHYYVDVLGFTNAEWGGDTYTCVTRDNAAIYLSQGDQGQPGTWDVDRRRRRSKPLRGVQGEGSYDTARARKLSVGVRNESAGP